MRVTPISEIVKNAASIADNDGKIAYLSKFSNNKAITTLFQFAYDSNLEILLPDSIPPFKRTKRYDAESIFYLDAELLRKVITNSGFYPLIKQRKREEIFIRTLEDMDGDDADILASVVLRKGFDGIPVDVAQKVFGFGEAKSENTK